MKPNLGNFAKQHRTRLEKFAGRSVRLQQLATSHPMLFFALANSHGRALDRGRALRLVERGEPLRSVCEVMRIPYSLRRVPAEILDGALPDVTLSEASGRQLADWVIAHPKWGARALFTAHFGTRVCDEAFGMWLASPAIACHLDHVANRALIALAVYAWYSRQSEHRYSRAARRVWAPDMGFAPAIQEAFAWCTLLDFELLFGEEPIADTWAEAGSFGGFDIVPLRTSEDLIGEAHYMENCLTGYATILATNRARLFGVRTAGARVGTVEVNAYGNGSLGLVQFKGKRNGPVPAEAYEAVGRWMAGQQSIKAGGPVLRVSRSLPSGPVFGDYIKACRIDSTVLDQSCTLFEVRKALKEIGMPPSNRGRPVVVERRRRVSPAGAAAQPLCATRLITHNG